MGQESAGPHENGLEDDAVSGCCGQSAMTSEVRFIKRRDWPEMWIRTAAPGDLLLLSDGAGQCGGILRLTVVNTFVTLDVEQVWHRKAVPWPFKEDRISSFRVLGNKIEYILR